MIDPVDGAVSVALTRVVEPSADGSAPPLRYPSGDGFYLYRRAAAV
jgi:hypothetical protein